MTRAASIALAVLALAACGSEDEPAAPQEPLTVEQALERDGERVEVRGYLFVTAGEGVRLCSLLAESYPPQCGGATLQVEGLATDDLPPLERAQGVGWSDGEVSLRGTVDGETLRATATG